MALHRPGRKQSPMGVPIMLGALIVAAFLGAAAGLIWQSTDWADEETPEEVVTAEAAAG
ncbi:hypothetical protein [Aurantiacibacter luteus]|uniref:hypothetical protein n=1 Tax=Aurantiacibacter luteus TaxID=1581420 RepID=UPI0012E01C4A|nr:hypothetical protein [Aurantiacibacter luteus]